MDIVLVGQNWLGAIWPRITPHLTKLCDRHGRDRWTEADLLAECQSGHKQLWIACDPSDVYCACLTEIVNCPQGRWGRVVALGGHDMRRWIEGLRTIEAWMKGRGCIGVEIIGRKGWERALARDGYMAESVMLSRRL